MMKKGFGKLLSRNKNTDTNFCCVKGNHSNKQQQQQQDEERKVAMRNPISVTATDNGVDLEVVTLGNNIERNAKLSQEVLRTLKQSSQQQQQQPESCLPNLIPTEHEQDQRRAIWGPTVSDTSSTTTTTASVSAAGNDLGVKESKNSMRKSKQMNKKSKSNGVETTSAAKYSGEQQQQQEQNLHRTDSYVSNILRGSPDIISNSVAAIESFECNKSAVDAADQRLDKNNNGFSVLNQVWQRASNAFGISSSLPSRGVNVDDAATTATEINVPDEPYTIPFMNCFFWVTTPSGDGGCVPFTDVFGAGNLRTPAVMTPPRGGGRGKLALSNQEQIDIDPATDICRLVENEDEHNNKAVRSQSIPSGPVTQSKMRSHLSEAASSTAAQIVEWMGKPHINSGGVEQNVNHTRRVSDLITDETETTWNDQQQQQQSPQSVSHLTTGVQSTKTRANPFGVAGRSNTTDIPPKQPGFLSRAAALVTNNTILNNNAPTAGNGTSMPTDLSNIGPTYSKDTNEAFYKGNGDIIPSSSNLESVHNPLFSSNQINLVRAGPSNNGKNNHSGKKQSVSVQARNNGAENGKGMDKVIQIAPFALLTLNEDTSIDMQRDVSELTMRSSYASAMAHYNLVHYGMTTVTADSTNNNKNGNAKPGPESSRRMAYYAVGQISQQTSMIKSKNSGGNRRCYFTGKLILGGAPFYAGCVQQGLRTLVVFCLPSALNLPDKAVVAKYRSRLASMKGSKPQSQRSSISGGLQFLSLNENGTGSSGNSANKTTGNNSSGVARTLRLDLSNNSGGGGGRYRSGNGRSSKRSMATGSVGGGTYNSASIAAGSQQEYSQVTGGSRMSRYTNNGGTYYDERTIGTGLSIESDLDSNWNVDPSFLLQVLPVAGTDLLQSMLTLYKDQFETLPVQVRNASQWKLYIKFCFFSGLPISQEEVHYKVRESIAEQVYYGEEITLSHEVMEACEGSASAELLTLPNRNVLQYIKKHYPQQCAKIDYDARVFLRSSWERMSPEV